MSSMDSTHPRFLRPADVAGIRRNQNRIQMQRVLQILRGLLAGAVILAAGAWVYRHTQSNARFAVRTIEVSGAAHTTRADIDRITREYTGLNLFKIDIARVQHDLRSLPWVSRVDIEKKLPGTLIVKIAERSPVALARHGSRFRYVDEQGIAFAALTAAVGDPDLPVISGDDLTRCVRLLRDLRRHDPQVYSRISEVRAVVPDGFAIFDRDLGAFVYANTADLSTKWRSLHAIASTESFQRGAIEYADLRFADRIVIKPVLTTTAEAVPVVETTAAPITN